MHYVYKYVLNNQIIYIGKTDCKIEQRISQHGKNGDNIPKEAWADINKSDIFYIELPNAVMADVVESELIRRYKPRYNKAKMSEWGGIPFAEPEWKKYIKKRPIQSKSGKPYDEQLKQQIERYKNLLRYNNKAYSKFLFIKNEIEKERYDLIKDAGLSEKILIKCHHEECIPFIPIAAHSRSDHAYLLINIRDNGYIMKRNFLDIEKTEINDFLEVIEKAKNEYRGLVRKYISYTQANKELKTVV